VRDVSPFERFGASHPEADVHLEEYVVVAGDTITGIAYRRLGDWRLWREIADRNGLVDVRQLEPGTTLFIPERPLETGRYESV
jgi:nucleoid-associated protein YgaU